MIKSINSILTLSFYFKAEGRGEQLRRGAAVQLNCCAALCRAALAAMGLGGSSFTGRCVLLNSCAALCYVALRCAVVRCCDWSGREQHGERFCFPHACYCTVANLPGHRQGKTWGLRRRAGRPLGEVW